MLHVSWGSHGMCRTTHHTDKDSVAKVKHFCFFVWIEQHIIPCCNPISWLWDVGHSSSHTVGEIWRDIFGGCKNSGLWTSLIGQFIFFLASHSQRYPNKTFTLVTFLLHSVYWAFAACRGLYLRQTRPILHLVLLPSLSKAFLATNYVLYCWGKSGSLQAPDLREQVHIQSYACLAG